MRGGILQTVLRIQSDEFDNPIPRRETFRRITGRGEGGSPYIGFIQIVGTRNARVLVGVYS